MSSDDTQTNGGTVGDLQIVNVPGTGCQVEASKDQEVTKVTEAPVALVYTEEKGVTIYKSVETLKPSCLYLMPDKTKVAPVEPESRPRNTVDFGRSGFEQFLAQKRIAQKRPNPASEPSSGANKRLRLAAPDNGETVRVSETNRVEDDEEIFEEGARQEALVLKQKILKKKLELAALTMRLGAIASGVENDA